MSINAVTPLANVWRYFDSEMLELHNVYAAVNLNANRHYFGAYLALYFTGLPFLLKFAFCLKSEMFLYF